MVPRWYQSGDGHVFLVAPCHTEQLFGLSQREVGLGVRPLATPTGDFACRLIVLEGTSSPKIRHFAERLIRWPSAIPSFGPSLFIQTPLTNAADRAGSLLHATGARPPRRGLTRVKEMRAEGITVGWGQDCVLDPWYSLGTADLLDVAFMGLHMAQMTHRSEIARCLRMVTEDNARIMNLADCGLTRAPSPRW